MIVRVGVADDQPLIRTGLRSMIDHAPDLELVGEASDGEEAVELARRERPDVVLMDIRMPVLDGIEATRRITSDADLAAVRVVMLTTFDVDDYVHAAIRAGASGFLLKDAPPEDVLDAIRVVFRGDALLAPSVTRRIIEELASRPDPSRAAPPQLDLLTDREREVLSLVGRGLSNAEIGARLYVSPATAKTHVSHVMTKLYARDRAQLVVIAYESGIIRPGLTHQELAQTIGTSRETVTALLSRFVTLGAIAPVAEGYRIADEDLLDDIANGDVPVSPRHPVTPAPGTMAAG